jgi:dienelactone hydrolase
MENKFLQNILRVALILCFPNVGLYAQQVFKTTDESVIAYLEYLPQGYELNSDKYPVVIFLHGIGERGTNTTDVSLLEASVLKVANLGPPNYVKKGHQFPFILISPQLKNNYGHWPSSYVMEVIHHVKTYLRIDEKRIYLTGLSLGGGGAWWTAQDYPELFAALAPVCGGRNTPDKACAIAAENLPVWAFHGDKDTIVPLSRSVNMVNAINACQPAPVPAAKMTIYPGVGHNAWTNAYKTDHSVHDPNVYEWMLSFTNTINGTNKLPSAKAGADQTLSLSSTYLTGSGSDPDGSISSYYWNQVSGPTQATLLNHTTSKLYAKDLKTGNYLFSLRVTDNSGDTDTDYVSVNVSENQLPVASAGRDRLVLLPANKTSIVGTATDDSSIVSWTWTQMAGIATSMSGVQSSTLNVAGLVSGNYKFRLTVRDNAGLADYDDVLVRVTQPPVAYAGVDAAVILPATNVTLTGSASDPDGVISAYRWSKYSGPAVTLTNQTTSTVTVTDLREGTYVFVLKVTDNATATATDYVTLTVKKAILSADTQNTSLSKITVSLPPDEDFTHPAGAVFGNLKASDLEDCLITVFNDGGERIFSGMYSSGLYEDVFKANGLYLYQILKQGKRVASGKIFVRR